MAVRRSSIFEVGMLLVLIIKLDNDISTAFIMETTQRSATSTKTTKVCDNVDIPANGNISYSNESRVVNTTVTYTCHVGYELNGPNSRTCTVNGTWNSTDPRCDLKVCNETDTPANGNISYSNEHCVVGTSVTYTCHVGYELDGANIRTCTTSGTWDGADPICRLKVHGYNETCIESGPDGQCSTVNAICLRDGDGTGYRCRCTEEDYYHQDNDSCLKQPEPVQTMRFEEIWEKNFTVVWDNNSNRPCKSYTISLDTTEKRVTIPRTKDTSQRFTFTNLKGGTGYVVTITAEVPGQSSDPLSKTSYTRPEPVTNVTVAQVLSNAITLQLTGTGTQEGGYKIYVTPNMTDSVEKTITRTLEIVMIGGLKAGREYTFTVYTYYQNLESERILTLSAYNQSKEYVSQGSNTGTIVVAFVSGVGITLVAFGVVIYLKRRRLACFSKREDNNTHGVSGTIQGTEMMTKTSANKVLRSASKEQCSAYDFIGNQEEEERSAYYNVDRNHYDVLERSNDQSHEYGTLGQDGAKEHANINGKMYENLRTSPKH